MKMTNVTHAEEANLKLNNGRSEDKRAEKLKAALRGKKVTILGHDNIDVDATLSGILMSRLLDFLGIENEFCILEKVKKDDTYEIVEELFGMDMEEWENVSEDYERNLFLLDHYETIHMGNVIGCIDHHPNQAEKSYDFMYTRNACAAAYLIYEIMKEVKYPVTEEDAKMIVVSMMVDTTAFRSSKTIEEEAMQAEILADDFGLNYLELEKYCLCLTPVDKLSVDQIISNGQKWYNYNGNKIGSSYLQLYGLPDETTLKGWIKALHKKREETESCMLVFIIFETKSNTTYEYQITEGKTKCFVKMGILSRGKDIMPLIEKKFSRK